MATNCITRHSFLLLLPYYFHVAVASDHPPPLPSPPRKNSYIALPLFQTHANASSSQISAAALRITSQYNVSMTVTVSVGTPPQRKTMVVDTGSELCWLQCTHQDAISFNASVSSTFHQLSCANAACSADTTASGSSPFTACDEQTCRFALTYADGTEAEGTLAQDVAALGDTNETVLPEVLFGCADSSFLDNSTGQSGSSSGILGLNQGPLSLIEQMGALGYRKKFSYCIGVWPSAGVLVLGDLRNNYSYTRMVSTKLPLPYFDRVAYTVGLQGIRVGERLLPLPKWVLEPDHTGAGQTMIDSATQFSFLMGDVYGPLKSEFLKQTQHLSLAQDISAYEGVLDLCYLLPANASLSAVGIPPVTLLFDSAEMVVDSRRLLYLVGNESCPSSPSACSVYCLSFGNSDVVGLEANVIGNYQQQGLWIEFDLERSSVGFAPHPHEKCFFP